VINHQQIRRILIINLKWLGDLIVSTPVFKTLRKDYPHSNICVMVRKEYETVLKTNPHIDEIIPFDYKIRSLTGWKRLREEIHWVKKLRAKHFDAVISLHPGDRLAWWAWLSGARYRVAPRKQSFGYLYNIQVDVEEDTKSYLEYYLDVVRAFDAKPVTWNTEFIVSDKLGMWAGQLLRQHGIMPEHVVIGVHPGASEPSKIWPAENFAELIERLLTYPHLKIIFFQGPNEKAIISKISSLMSMAPFVVDTSNNVEQMAALMKRCNLCIVNDSGARHLAVAVNVPTLTFFPADRLTTWQFYTEEDKHYVLLGNRFETSECQNSSPFLDSITVDDAFNKVRDILQL